MSNELIIESLKPLEADIKTIKTDPRNARKHNERNIETIKNSLKTYGQRKPIVVNINTNTIEAGNGMYQAAKALGWDKIAVVFVDDAQEVATAYGLMDNQSALISEWDLPTLKDLLTELDDGEVNMDLTGFDVNEIENLMTQVHNPDFNSYQSLSNEEIKKQENDLNTRFKDASDAEKERFISLICPKCCYEYSVRRDDIDKKTSV